jgi:hypothetical protein
MKKALTIVEVLLGAFLVNMLLVAALMEAWADYWVACVIAGLVLGWPVFQTLDALLSPDPEALNPWVEAVFRAENNDQASRIPPPTPWEIAAETLRLRLQRLKR